MAEPKRWTEDDAWRRLDSAQAGSLNPDYTTDAYLDELIKILEAWAAHAKYYRNHPISPRED